MGYILAALFVLIIGQIFSCKLSTPAELLDKVPAPEITSFSINGAAGILNNDTITIFVNSGLADLVAEFKTTAYKVTVENIPQISGVTKNDFTTAKSYSFFGFEGAVKTVVVSVVSFTNFSINGISGTIGSESVNFVVKWWGVSNLIASFSVVGATVSVDGVDQSSGVTPNSFVTARSYKLTASNGISKIYVVTVNVTYPFADTGQILCASGVSADGAGAACPNVNIGAVQDADFIDRPAARSITSPTAHATYTNDRITFDHVTGLTWKSCAEGLSGATCASGSATSFTLNPDTATPACLALNSANGGAGYAGQTNWRLPTILELSTIINYNPVSFAKIDAASFPNTGTNVYWSSTSYAFSALTAWSLDFFVGTMSNTAKTSGARVRCVASVAGGYTPPRADNGDGTITDKSTNLVWQKCSRGQTNDATCSGAATTANWLTAFTYCQGLSLASRAWSVPNVRELQSLVDYEATVSPVINPQPFPSTAPNPYWTSSTNVQSGSDAFNVAFNNGVVSSSPKSTLSRVRCVATGP